MTTADYARRFPRTALSFERRYETSDGLVAVALWSVGGLALTLLFIWRHFREALIKATAIAFPRQDEP